MRHLGSAAGYPSISLFRSLPRITEAQSFRVIGVKSMKNAPLLPALRILTRVLHLFIALALTVVFAQPARAQTESVIYNDFVTGSGVGGGPYTGLIADSAGNLYGAAGSNMYNGAAYELIPSSGGIWTLKILHEFTTSDGVGASAGFTMDAAGNLYAPDLYGGNGYGSVLRTKPIFKGNWNGPIPFKFRNNRPYGHYSGATLTLDPAVDPS